MASIRVHQKIAKNTYVSMSFQEYAYYILASVALCVFLGCIDLAQAGL